MECFLRSKQRCFFIGSNIAVQDGQLIAGFGIQREGSSTMCVSNYVLILSQKGEILNFGGGGGYLCGAGPSVEITALSELFKYTGKYNE